MKKLNFLTIIIVVSVKLSAINIQINSPNVGSYNGWNNENYNKYIYQFVIPISQDGINLNPIIEFTVTDVNSSIGLKIRNDATQEIVNTYTFTGTSGTFQFNTSNTVSGLYVFEFYYIASGNIIDIVKPNPINAQDLRPVKYYFVTERQKTGIFNNSNNFNYKVSWVDSWLGVLDTIQGHVSANNFLAITEDAPRSA